MSRATVKEVRELMEDEDLHKAMEVLRTGLTAVTRVRAKAPPTSSQKYEYREVPDNSVRLTCAKLLLEYGFGKPHTRSTIELKGDPIPKLTSADIAQRIAASGADLQRIADAYVGGLASAVDVDPAELEG